MRNACNARLWADYEQTGRHSTLVGLLLDHASRVFVFTEPMIRKLAEHAWNASRKESRIARTVVLKLKTSEFKTLTRSHTPGSPPSSCEELTNIALSLRERVGLSPQQRFHLVGVGMSNFCDSDLRMRPLSRLFSPSGSGFQFKSLLVFGPAPEDW